MPPRDPELPEGTDKIIAGASKTETSSAGTAASAGSRSSSGGSSGTSRSGGTSSGGGFVARGAGNDTGGTAGAADKIVSQVRDQVNSLRDQASDRAREFAEGGKDRTTQLLDDIAEIIHDAARSIDDRLGDQYGEYAHKAGDAVQGISGNLRGKSLEDLIEGTRSIVRKSPAVTVGTAALLGFVLVRLVKSGLESGDRAGGSGGNSSGGGRRSDSGGSGGSGGGA